MKETDMVEGVFTIIRAMEAGERERLFRKILDAGLLEETGEEERPSREAASRLFQELCERMVKA